MVAESQGRTQAACNSGAMELDDDMLDQMAEAAVPSAEDGDTAIEDRKARVAEAKARLKSKKSDLEQGLSKVRKIGAKKS